ncbi:MAG: ABC transporter ATP-binding protein [Planctomycetota bacterium]
MELAIETDGLTRFFEDFCAVNDVNLKVERGTFYGFLGPNGAGKSTTIKMLTGLLTPSAGTVKVLGGNPLNDKQAIQIKSQIGVVPENLALFENLTAREYLTFVGRMYLMEKQTMLTRIDELLDLMKLQDAEKKITMEYSHGMQKKLALAAALLPNPDLLFLDEPFEGVDAVASRVLRDTLSNYVSRGSTVFLTSHVLEIVERLCTHVGIIANGQLVEQCSLSELQQGSSLEERFLERVGNDEEASQKLSWLEEETA